MGRTLRVDVPVLDIWSKPKSNSERVNQLICNETVTRLSETGDFVRIRCEDSYVGWVRADHLHADIISAHSWFVDVPVASLLDGSTGRFVGKLSFGTRISILERTETFGRINFRGKDAWISLGCVSRKPRSKQAWRKIKSYLENLIGTPYLWGGRSGFGLDCSGIVQLVFNSCGYSLPRDSSDQRKSGRRVSVMNLKPGDLIFSPGHVSVYYGTGQIIHSSARAGGVFVENLMPGSPNCRSDIFEKIELVKRLL
ncbi:MAG: C40 family peptidase [Candidatus Zixiibacteriota bacterium]